MARLCAKESYGALVYDSTSCYIGVCGVITNDSRRLDLSTMLAAIISSSLVLCNKIYVCCSLYHQLSKHFVPVFRQAAIVASIDIKTDKISMS